MAPRPPLTVVVPCRDRAEQLARCLEGLREALRADDEVVVSDSASADERVAGVARQAGARLVRCSEPGASRARNAGWRAANRAYVAFTDDDMTVTPGWVEALAAAVSDAGVGFAVGHTAVPPAAGGSGEPASVTRLPPPTFIAAGTRGVIGSSNNLALPVAVLEHVGGFDERLGPGTWFAAGEDLELLDRVLAAGWNGRYVPTAVAYHEQWRTSAQRRQLQWAYGKGMGARVAALSRRDPRAGWALRSEVLRLDGLRTLRRRVRRPSPSRSVLERPTRDGAGQVDDVSGWAGPVLWRMGALLGLGAGLVTLPPAAPTRPGIEDVEEA